MKTPKILKMGGSVPTEFNGSIDLRKINGELDRGFVMKNENQDLYFSGAEARALYRWICKNKEWFKIKS